MDNLNYRKIAQLEADYKRIRENLLRKVAITAVNFFKRNFRRGGFVDRPFKKWKETRDMDRGGTTLVRSGNLRRSIKKKVKGDKILITAGGNLPYAEIHNEGGKVPITPKMRRYFWAMYQKTGKDKYKAMALTKKKEIVIPQRKFIGDSKVLDKTIERMIIKELKTLQR